MIKQKTNIRTIVLATAAFLGAAASAVAQNAPAAPAVSSSAGLLGQNYAGAEFTYVHFNKSLPKIGQDYGFLFNQALTTGLDLGANYDYQRSNYAGMKFRNHSVGLDLTSYLSQSWGKPFLQAGAGYLWTKAGTVRHNSYTYVVGTGVEFPIGTAFAVAPFVSYQAAPRIGGNHEWNFGVKSSYRVTKEWSLSLTSGLNEHKDARYTLGANYHF